MAYGMQYSCAMTRTQKTIANQLQSVFERLETFAIVEGEKYVTVYMSRVTYDCKGRLHNIFRIGKRGALEVIKQEFKAI